MSNKFDQLLIYIIVLCLGCVAAANRSEKQKGASVALWLQSRLQGDLTKCQSYETLTKDLPSSTVVEGGKNLVRIWVEFDKKMALFLWWL
jgi:hypothetical protein